MAINYDSKEDMGYLYIALRECCGLDDSTIFKVKDINSAGSYDGIEILASDTNSVTKPSQSDWTQNDDVPTETKTKWQTYRQTLRDLPANQTPSDMFLSNITWPTKPS